MIVLLLVFQLRIGARGSSSGLSVLMTLPLWLSETPARRAVQCFVEETSNQRNNSRKKKKGGGKRTKQFDNKKNVLQSHRCWSRKESEDVSVWDHASKKVDYCWFIGSKAAESVPRNPIKREEGFGFCSCRNQN